MPALLAVVQRESRTVRLEPAVMVGDSIHCRDGDEVFLVRTSQVGHLGEHASHMAFLMRTAGWTVDVADCSDLTPRWIQGQPKDLTHDHVKQSATNAANQLLVELGDEPVELALPPIPTTLRNGAKTRIVCLTCGHATVGLRNQASHRRNLGHQDFQTAPRHDVPALQARIRARNDQQASTPELQEALLEAAD